MSDGLITAHSSRSVAEILDGITHALEASGVKIFAVIDHSGEAAKAGLTMPETKVVIFGNPKAGTPLMLANPSIAIDLPLKLLLAATPGGGTDVTIISGEWLAARHNIPAELANVLNAPQKLLQKVTS